MQLFGVELSRSDEGRRTQTLKTIETSAMKMVKRDMMRKRKGAD